MNKSLFIAFACGAAIALASCSSVEEPAINSNHDIVVSVTAPIEPMSRGAITLPEGYTMHCIMQLLGENNEQAGEQKQAVIDPATGTGSFVITAADQEKGVKALFWAEYVDADGKSVYNTADLTAVGFATDKFDLNKTNATEAFCGQLLSLKDGANVTLTRPFANVNFTPTNPEKAENAKSLTVSYKAPSAYNVLNATTTDEVELTYTTDEFNAASTPWFSTFVFAPVNLTSLESDVNINLSNGLTQTLTIEAGKIPLNANFQINVSATIGDVQLSDINVSVGIDTDYSKPKFEVGAYVNAKGEAVADRADAVGIVYMIGSLPKDNITLYGDTYAGKSIKGYAVALENVVPTRQYVNDEIVEGLTQNLPENGAIGTPYMLNGIADSPFAKTFESWKSTHALECVNTTDWYIPCYEQALTWLQMLIPAANAEPTGSESFRAKFPVENIYESADAKAVYYASCTINSGGNISGVLLENGTSRGSQLAIASKTKQAALCRPMITIFE